MGWATYGLADVWTSGRNRLLSIHKLNVPSYLNVLYVCPTLRGHLVEKQELWITLGCKVLKWPVGQKNMLEILWIAQQKVHTVDPKIEVFWTSSLTNFSSMKHVFHFIKCCLTLFVCIRYEWFFLFDLQVVLMLQIFQCLAIKYVTVDWFL